MVHVEGWHFLIMRIKDIQDENFQDYKKVSMFICTAQCNGKCWRELRLPADTCQNNAMASHPTINLPDLKIVERYLRNPITKAIVIGGLEPFEQTGELLDLIKLLRSETSDDIVIYTGYTETEIREAIEWLSSFKNIIVKFGRYLPGDVGRYDPILGVTLASSNQYAKIISR